MWLRNIFRRPVSHVPTRPRTALDEQLLRRLERLGLQAARGLRGSLSGQHASRRRLPAPTFTDHRPYSSGDDLRYVDWNAYARLDDLHLKLGEAEQDIRVNLLVDCSASMDWGVGDTNKLHYARLLAATIGYVALASGDRLRVVPFGAARTARDGEERAGASGRTGQAPWGPGSGRQRAAGLLQYLDALDGGGEVATSERLRQIAREERGGLLVILSDLLHSPDLVTGPSPALAPFQLPRWQVLVLHVLHPEEFRPDLRGDVELIDSETGARLALEADRPSIAAYTAAVERWSEELAVACERRGVTYAGAWTDMSIERATLPYLKLREVLR